ncbi:hypothetical protein DNTS_030077 [Danionella cerebrum]|uniref:Nuclear protein MDM1 n=1 Tax=Danionella cerebrum TaxID=2873325 RepID=A0A553QSV6_9TELE|nr:hypothetical protein DNTS_030077 [Danionella translucida]
MQESDGFHEWYVEVKELRKRAEAYKKRAWGTHFSRQHLNQIMSEHNWMWETSTLTSHDSCTNTCSSPIIEALDLAGGGSVRGSFSPGPSASAAASRRSSTQNGGLPEEHTLPVQRRLAWDEDEQLGERDLHQSEGEQERSTDENNQRNPKKEHEEQDHRLDESENESATSAVQEGSQASLNGGRLPTPKLKTMQNIQRTHHDRTTPATALLVSPPRNNSSSRRGSRKPGLGKPHSPYRHITDDSQQRLPSQAENGSLPRFSPAAGLTTVDLLPMREDVLSEELANYTNTRQHKPSQQHPTSHVHKALSPNRIQGTMRNPEFQHNGNLGIFRPDLFAFPASEATGSDNDDKMSQISSRSAASCSMASEVLSRAQRRKGFWGKS